VVGARGLEPPASWSQTMRSSQTELRPEEAEKPSNHAGFCHLMIVSTGPMKYLQKLCALGPFFSFKNAKEKRNGATGLPEGVSSE
jgi:hypothetical protein